MSLPPALKAGSSGSNSLVFLGDGCITFTVKKFTLMGMVSVVVSGSLKFTVTIIDLVKKTKELSYFVALLKDIY
jgi:hypothetical protein